jgi:hypothetical protein
MLSDQTDIFTILASQTSYVAPSPGTTNTAFQTYNGCGLPPLPDYTDTGYQPPCTTTVNGQAETLYPIVPASDSSSFYGVAPSAPASPTSTVISSSSPTINTAFATGVYAQALQCPTPVMPITTMFTSSGATTVFSLVGCATPSGVSNNGNDGVCHTSGYTTFSVSGTSSVCCPNGWATTPLNSELFCFTSIGKDAKRAVEERQVSTETLSGLVFTSAGVVAAENLVETGSSSTGSGSHSINVTSTATSSAASASMTKSGGAKLDLGLWSMGRMGALIGSLYILYN